MCVGGCVHAGVCGWLAMAASVVPAGLDGSVGNERGDVRS